MLAQFDSSCLAPLGVGVGSYPSPGECPGEHVLGGLFKKICGCNAAIRSITGITGDGCEEVDFFTYGCDVPDAVIDGMRLEAYRRYKAAFNLSRTDYAKELKDIFTIDAVFTYLGVETYRGVDAIVEGTLFMNPLEANNLVVSSSTLEVPEVRLDAHGFRIGAVDFSSAHGDTIQFAQGSYTQVEFLQCSSAISSFFRLFDDFSFRTIIVQPSSMPQYTQLESVQLPMASYTFGDLSPEQIYIGKEWAHKFYNLGSHDCINGMWNEAVYMRTWQSVGDSGVDCLVLGKASYLKLYPSDDDDYGDFTLHYEHRLKDIHIKGTRRFEITSENNGEASLEVALTIEGRHLGSMDIPVGTSKCINLWMLKYCGSWGEDAGARRLEGSLPKLELYMEVEGEKTERATVWDPNVLSTTTSSTTQPLGTDWRWSASLSGPIAAVWAFALRYA
jgi:hypothetical protein